MLRIKKRLKRNAQWLRAIYMALRHGGAPVYRSLWSVAGKVMFHVVLEVRPDTKPGSLWWIRIKRGCGRCPIYSTKRKTCGNYVDDLGCLCFMPIKAGMPLEKCWAREQGINVGWTV